MRFADVDEQLLLLCRQDDEEAFERLCGHIQRDLYGFLYSILHDHDEADEALQECLVRVYKHLPQLKDLNKFPGWLLRMAVNQCNTQLGRSNARKLYPLDESIETPNERVLANPANAASPRDILERRQMMSELGAAISALPPRQRAAIVMFEVAGQSIREIAAALDCSEGAVKFNIHAARQKLKQSLAQYLPGRNAKGATA
ncbi:MAG: RNA polymerase sigma factor [bacterium]|nr:RNA polymerase sigma factor [Candidatus Sumerlaeota bacterium]